MKIVLLGHGNMGREVKGLINESRNHQIVAINLQRVGDEIDEVVVKTADVVIDFTSPQIVLENIKRVAAIGTNMVVGTTGWYENLDEVEKIVKKSGIGLIYAQNFSVGANMFFQVVAHAAKLMSRFGNYDVYGFEVHHVGKKDSPSGTALRLAKEIMMNFPQKNVVQTEKLDRQINSEELHFASIRGGRNPGFHQVVFDSSADSITLSHAAHNRRGFAEGALLAAEFILDKKGLFTIDDVFKNEGGEK
jgi:4-hydroxy-tetrahydrodipicolinate reductase